MKKLIILTAFILFSGFTFCQTLEKGNLIGVHVLDLKLQPDVTYNQWKNFYMNKWFPALENAYKGDVEMYLIEGIRGDKENEIGLIFLFKSTEARNKWFDEEGSIKESLLEEFRANFDELREERDKLRIVGSAVYTDWVVQ